MSIPRSLQRVLPSAAVASNDARFEYLDATELLKKVTCHIIAQMQSRSLRSVLDVNKVAIAYT